MKAHRSLSPPAIAAAAAVALLAGCTPKPPSAELFPLEAGHRWTYKQSTEWEDDSRDTVALVMRTLGGEDFDGKPAFRRHSEDGVDYWLRRDAGGIYRVAMRHELLEAEPKKDAAPRYVLKEPLVVGTEWQSTTVPYLLKRRQGFPAELKHDATKVMIMRYAIEALKQTVTVPAGRFEGCLKVRGEAGLKIYADPVTGWRELPVTTTEWYCPGPGLVKLERDEPAKSPFMIGGRLLLELQEWQAP